MATLSCGGPRFIDVLVLIKAVQGRGARRMLQLLIDKDG